MPLLHVDDIELHYEITGRGEPLLFIHGLGCSGRDWQPQIDFFSLHYRVVVFDIRGHGQSSRPLAPYSIKRFAVDTAKLIENLLAPPVHVVGLSLGGMIAFQLAVDRPELLKSMAVVNASPEVKLKSPQQWLMALQRYFIVRFLGMRKMGEFLAGKLFPGAAYASVREIFIARLAENDRKIYLQAMRSIVGWSVADRIGQITVPTLVVASDYDYIPVSVKEAFVARMPHAELTVIRGAHHAVPVEFPDRFNAVIATFLERQGQGSLQEAD